MAFVASASGGIYDTGSYYYPSTLAIGTTTPWSANATVINRITNEPLGKGAMATTTVMIGDESTTTSRSSIQMNNSVGAAECAYIVGTAWVISAGACK